MHVLTDGGWSAQRKLSKDKFIRLLKDAEIAPNDAALQFLEKFGDLHLTFASGKKSGTNQFHFELEEALDSCFKRDIQDYGDSIGTPLCPVGELNRGNSIIAIASDGRVYSYFSPFISLEGMDYVDAIERFCTEDKPIKTLIYQGQPLDFLNDIRS
jgi:hypothetical protein